MLVTTLDKDSPKLFHTNRNQIASALALGTNMSVGMIVCTLAGHYIDAKINTPDPYFTLGGMFLGLVYCGWEVWKVIRKLEQK